MRKFIALFLLTTPLFAASREPIIAKHGIVASTSEIASRVGVEVMKKGGNAVDAAVATALALAATWDMYLDPLGNVIKGASTDGYKAIGVPGTIAGLMLAHKRHGKLKWSELVEPARRLAAEGFIISPFLESVLHED